MAVVGVSRRRVGGVEAMRERREVCIAEKTFWNGG